MNREQLKEHLHKLRVMLDELECKDGQTSGKLGLLAKGLEVYDCLQEMHMTDTLEMYGRLDEARQAQFIGLINQRGYDHGVWMYCETLEGESK